MSKKGQIVVKFIIILMISAAIIVLYPYVGEKFGKGDFYKKEMAAKEIALIIDALYSFPYDVTLFYEKDLTGLKIEISDNQVTVYDSIFTNKNLDPIAAEYQFFTPDGIKVDAKLENPKKIRIEKKRNAVNLKKDEAQ